MNIQNRTFLIGGGASGLGLATAKMIIDNGGSAILADINDVAGAQAEKELGGKAVFVQTDVRDELSVQAAIDQGQAKFGTIISGLINCAGVGPAKRVLGRSGVHPLNMFDDVVQINLVGSFNMLRLASVAMANNELGEGGERGVIINTASVAAFDGQIGQAAYAASKGGIVAMTLPIARELARVGIRVLTIAPGIFETPLLENLPVDVKESLGQQVPFPPRLGRPDEFASLVREMISNQMLNGEVVRLDGSIRMTAK